MNRQRIPAVRETAEQIEAALGDAWLPEIYRERILKARTRSFHFGEIRKIGECNRVKIQHTLLGVEIKMGRRRLLCPDLATARYLAVFARAGCKDVAIPYDITRISFFTDWLESSWQRMLLLVAGAAPERSEGFRSRIRGLLIAKLRSEIAAAGAGTAIPGFKQSTRQRRVT